MKQHIKTSNFSIVSGTTVLYWDFCLLLPSEISYIWAYIWVNREFSKLRVTYLLIKYVTVLVYALMTFGKFILSLGKRFVQLTVFSRDYTNETQYALGKLTGQLQARKHY